MPANSRLFDIVARHGEELLPEWMKSQLAAVTSRRDLVRDDELLDQSRRFLMLFRSSLQSDGTADIDGPAWAEMRDLLGDLSRQRARQGFSPS